jgi:hypothetical protein
MQKPIIDLISETKEVTLSASKIADLLVSSAFDSVQWIGFVKEVPSQNHLEVSLDDQEFD